MFDETLYHLQQQVQRKIHLEAMRNSLREENRQLNMKALDLKVAKSLEQADVEKLEKKSLMTIIYQLTGKFDEKLSKEKQEAYEAALKYDTVAREIEILEQKIRTLDAELGTLKNCEKEYSDALNAKKEMIKAEHSQDTEKLLELEQNLAALEFQKKEIAEATRAGSSASYMVADLLKNLKEAESWGKYDIVGGGTISTAMKYDYLEKAQHKLGQLQIQLRNFKSELSDVKIYKNLHVSVDSFSRVADYFFDGLFVDISVQSKIRNSISQVEQMKNGIQAALRKLHTMEEEADQEIVRLQNEIEELLIGK